MDHTVLFSQKSPEHYARIDCYFVGGFFIIVSVKFARGDLVAVSRFEHLVSNLLNKSHSFLIIDFYKGLEASDTEFPKGIRTVNGVV